MGTFVSQFMKVILIAAGRSKRLKPIEDKNFLMFLGKPLVQHQIEQLFRCGLEEILLVGGEHNIERFRLLADQFGGKIKVIQQENLEEGMAGAVLSSEKELESGPIMVMSANDVVEDEAILTLVKKAKGSTAQSFLLAKKVKSYFPGGYLMVHGSQKISGIIEKPAPGSEPSDLVNIVVHVHTETVALFNALHNVQTKQDDRYEVAMDRMMKDGIEFEAVEYNGFWQPIKYPWHIITVMNFFLAEAKRLLGVAGVGDIESPAEASNAEIAPSAVVKGEVYFGKGVKVLDQAVIQGPAYIGDNTVVATNALVRGSNIGANCVVGYSTEVARSYLGNEVWSHSNYFGDSVIGNNCSFGAGTVTGNLRLDEGNIQVNIQGNVIDSGMNKFGLVTGDHVRCGINTSFMPGVKIGNNCFIGAGIVVAQDIVDNSYVYAKTELTIKENKAVIDPEKREQMKKLLM